MDAVAATTTTSTKCMSNTSFEQELACDVDLIRSSSTAVSESDQRVLMKYPFDLNEENLSDVSKSVSSPNNNVSGDANVTPGIAVGSIEKKLDDTTTTESIVAEATTTKDSIIMETTALGDNIKSVVGSTNNNESGDANVTPGIAVGRIEQNLDDTPTT
jgi:hypothetical protein